MTKRTLGWVGAAVVAMAIVVVLIAWPREMVQRVRIGAILPLTGDAAVYGKHAKNGIEMAVATANETRSAADLPIEVIYEDSQADPKTGLSAFMKLATVDNVPAVLGPMGSSVALAVAPQADARKVVLLSPTASAPALTSAGPYFFRNVASDSYDGRAMAIFCRTRLNLARAAIVFVQNDFGLGLKNAFAQTYRENGGEVVAELAFNQGALDFRTQITRLKAVQPDCVFVVGYKEMGRFLKQCQELGLRSQYVSFSMFEDPDIIQQAGSVAEGAYYTFRSYDPSQADSRTAQFVSGYASRYGEAPDIFAALSYDAARLLVDAIRRGGDSGPEIRQALMGVQQFPGVTGDTTFDANGDVIKAIGIKAVKDGKFVWVERSYP